MICIIVLILFVVIFFLWIYYKKHTARNYNISVSNDMLVFSKVKDYYKFINGLNEKQKEKLIEFLTSTLEFNSLAINKQSDLHEQVNDGFIEFLLNKDGYVQIENYIYKVDPIAEATLAIHKNKFNETLISEISTGNYTSSSIVTYHIEDDVIGMVESNTQPSQRGLFCGESGCGGAVNYKNVLLTNPQDHSACNTLDCEVKYLRAGVYFSLSARCVNLCPSRRMYWHKDPVKYKVKCGRTYGPVSQWDIDSGDNGSLSNKWVKYFYQSVQPLNGFWLRIVFMAKDASWIGNPDNPSADLIIRKNM